jgi:hypothetical protein
MPAVQTRFFLATTHLQADDKPTARVLYYSAADALIRAVDASAYPGRGGNLWHRGPDATARAATWP